MKKLISTLIVILLLAGCSEKTQHVEEPVQDQCTKSVELRVAALSEVWSTAQYYYGYWNQMPEDFLTIDLMDAYEQLGTIIGEAVEDDLVNEIFGKFCMGK